jgi:ribose transport system permease protein
MSKTIGSEVQRGLNRYVIFIYVLSIALIFASKLISPSFGSFAQIQAILVLSSLTLLVGLGQGMVIMTGELDLSIGKTATLSGVLTSMWMGMGEENLYMIIPILIILLLVGLLNGIGVTYLRVPSFIMTLAMSMIIYGCILGYTKGTPDGLSPKLFEKLMTSRWFDIPSPIYVLVVVAVLGFLVQRYTRFGRTLYAVGSNRVAAHYAAIPVKRAIITAYMVSALCAGLTGILLVGYSGGSTLNMGDAYLLPSIATVVLGGASIAGGSGNYLGTVGAAIFLTTVSTIIQALGISIGWQTVIYGLMILCVLTLYRKDLLQLIKHQLRGWSGNQRQAS